MASTLPDPWSLLFSQRPLLQQPSLLKCPLSGCPGPCVLMVPSCPSPPFPISPCWAPLGSTFGPVICPISQSPNRHVCAAQFRCTPPPQTSPLGHSAAPVPPHLGIHQVSQCSRFQLTPSFSTVDHQSEGRAPPILLSTPSRVWALMALSVPCCSTLHFSLMLLLRSRPFACPTWPHVHFDVCRALSGKPSYK